MKEKACIPIVIGVTGHRQLCRQDEERLHGAVIRALQRIKALCPHSPLLMLCSLAEGGDLLCADAGEELGIPLAAVLPRERADYERDFSREGRERFSHHCARAEQIFVAPNTESVPVCGISREYQFRQASIYVASHCHILLALWDGAPGEHGCGTAETVDFALNGSYEPAAGMAFRCGSNEAVIHIFTPRKACTEKEAGAAEVLGNREAVLEILRRTDEFNQNASGIELEKHSRLPEGQDSDPLLKGMETVSRAAGRLSRQYAKRYRCVLALLAIASALLTFAFLMYDEAQMLWMILVCGILVLAAWGCHRYAVFSDCHRRYIEYRVLAECLRVQTYLRYAGSSMQAAELLSWTQQEETAWVMAALYALTIGDAQRAMHDIRICWVEDQRKYHQKAAKTSGQKFEASERVVQCALVLSIGLYLLGVGYELLCGGILFRPVIPVADIELWRTVLKILLGTISAGTLFVANYYGRLSLPRTVSDHQKMERFYAKLSEQLEKRGQTEKLLTVLAREELIENGNWCSYQRDNKPDISL